MEKGGVLTAQQVQDLREAFSKFDVVSELLFVMCDLIGLSRCVLGRLWGDRQ